MVPWCTVVVLAGLGLVGAKNALLPELSTSPREPDPPMSCNGEDMEACFGKQMAKAIPAQFLCNVSKLPPDSMTSGTGAHAAAAAPLPEPEDFLARLERKRMEAQNEGEMAQCTFTPKVNKNTNSFMRRRPSETAATASAPARGPNHREICCNAGGTDGPARPIDVFIAGPVCGPSQR